MDIISIEFKDSLVSLHKTEAWKHANWVGTAIKQFELSSGTCMPSSMVSKSTFLKYCLPSIEEYSGA